jgi:hypothetical protein
LAAGHAELDGRGSGGEFVELGELAARGGEADLQALDLTEPSLAAGFGDAAGEVVADLGEAAALGRVGAQQGAANTGVFMNTGRRVGPAAGAQGDLSAFEMAEWTVSSLVDRQLILPGSADRRNGYGIDASSVHR